jgi:hypothetical protein
MSSDPFGFRHGHYAQCRLHWQDGNHAAMRKIFRHGELFRPHGRASCRQLQKNIEKQPFWTMQLRKNGLHFASGRPCRLFVIKPLT